jgi:hypothetical protein
MNTKTMKAASPLGGLILAIGVVMIAVFGVTGMIGYYEIGTGSAINPALANQVNAIYGINALQTNPTGGVFGQMGALREQVQTQQNNTVGIIGSITAAASAAGSAFSFVGLITNMLNPTSPNSFMNVFVILPLQALGIPAGFAALTAYMILLGMLILLIFSALLIFNLL